MIIIKEHTVVKRKKQESGVNTKIPKEGINIKTKKIISNFLTKLFKKSFLKYKTEKIENTIKAKINLNSSNRSINRP